MTDQPQADKVPTLAERIRALTWADATRAPEEWRFLYRRGAYEMREAAARLAEEDAARAEAEVTRLREVLEAIVIAGSGIVQGKVTDAALDEWMVAEGDAREGK